MDSEKCIDGFYLAGEALKSHICFICFIIICKDNQVNLVDNLLDILSQLFAESTYPLLSPAAWC